MNSQLILVRRHRPTIPLAQSPPDRLRNGFTNPALQREWLRRAVAAPIAATAAAAAPGAAGAAGSAEDAAANATAATATYAPANATVRMGALSIRPPVSAEHDD